VPSTPDSVDPKVDNKNKTPRPSRRTLLKYGLGGSLLLAAGGLGLGLRRTVYCEQIPTLSVLSAREYSILTAVADRICPGSRASMPKASDLDVALGIDSLLATMESAAADEFRMVLLLLENALTGLVLEGRTAPFTACGPQRQDRVLTTWSTASTYVQSAGFAAMRSMVASVYWANPRTHAFCGYPGPPDYGQQRAPSP